MFQHYPTLRSNRPPDDLNPGRLEHDGAASQQPGASACWGMVPTIINNGAAALVCAPSPPQRARVRRSGSIVAKSAGMAASHAPACEQAWGRSSTQPSGRAAGISTCSRLTQTPGSPTVVCDGAERLQTPLQTRFSLGPYNALWPSGTDRSTQGFETVS